MNLFASYEREGFEISNIWHKFTLQYMFMNRIQDELNDFKSYWNNHPLSTENNNSPLQLMIKRYRDINHDEPIDFEHLGLEGEEIPVVNEDDVNPQVVLETLQCPLNEINYCEFKQRISPLTRHTLVTDLTNAFHAALQLVNDYRDMQ